MKRCKDNFFAPTPAPGCENKKMGAKPKVDALHPFDLPWIRLWIATSQPSFLCFFLNLYFTVLETCKNVVFTKILFGTWSVSTPRTGNLKKWEDSFPNHGLMKSWFRPYASFVFLKKDAAIDSECHRNHGFGTKPYKFVGFRKLPLPRQIHGFRSA